MDNSSPQIFGWMAPDGTWFPYKDATYPTNDDLLEDKMDRFDRGYGYVVTYNNKVYWHAFSKPNLSQARKLFFLDLMPSRSEDDVPFTDVYTYFPLVVVKTDADLDNYFSKFVATNQKKSSDQTK